MAIWPFDIETVRKSVEKTGRAVIVQEATRACSLSSELVAQIQNRNALQLKAPVGRVTGWDVPFPQFALENYFMPYKDRIVKEMKRILDF